MTSLPATLNDARIEQAVSMVINGLPSAASRRNYSMAARDFLGWYAERSRMGLNKATVQAYLAHLQATGTKSVNARLVAVRRLARELSDNQVIPEQVAAAIGRVEGA